MSTESANRFFDASRRPFSNSSLPPDEQVLSRTLNIETFQQWTSELDQFVTETRLRLKVLSQSVTHCQSHRPATSQATSLDTGQPETHSIRANEGEPIKAGSDQCETPAACPQGSSTVLDDVTDPMDRLNAIKMRLARQIDNAS